MRVLLTIAPGGRRRRDEARGIAGNQQFLIGRHDQRQDGPGTALASWRASSGWTSGAACR
jgi:hypothetical protein